MQVPNSSSESVEIIQGTLNKRFNQRFFIKKEEN
jgi:hypothetical protein